MGRTTDSEKTCYIQCRVSEETKAKVFAERDRLGLTLSEYIRQLLEGSVEGKRDEKIKIEGDGKRFESILTGSGLTTEKFMEYIERYFNEGKIYIDGIHVKTRGEYDTRELEEVCYRLNADPQEMIDRLTKSLMRG